MSVLQATGFSLPIGAKTYIMGLAGVVDTEMVETVSGKSSADVVMTAAALLKDGADLLDIGGTSARRGLPSLSETEELMRLLPVLENLPRSVHVPVCIESTRPAVVRRALQESAALVKCSSHVDAAVELMMVAADFGAGFILTHEEEGFRGESNPMYGIARYFEYAIKCAQNCGLALSNLILNPGVGENKTVGQNCEIIANLSAFRSFGLPILIDISRKAFLGGLTGLSPQKLDIPTIAANAVAIAGGADIICAHNVSAHVSAVKICDAMAKNCFT